MDRRLHPANMRVAAAHLAGSVGDLRLVEGIPARIAVPVANLMREDGRRDRQLLMGAPITVYEEHEGRAFVQALADDYVGYLDLAEVATEHQPTHRVCARSTHSYARPDIKSPERWALPMGALVSVADLEGSFAATRCGYVPLAHLCPAEERETDPVAVAERLLGAPYLWGGNSAFGIDCSGLVQAGLFACGQACPGDSDMQEMALGDTLPDDAPLSRGDLVFWKGHVGWVSDPDTLLHANAHHMAVAYEPLDAAIARIAEQGDGRPTRRARLAALPGRRAAQ